MKKANLANYQQNPELRAALFSTEDALLVEVSPQDRRWGAGLDIEDPRLREEAQWPGANLLGKILTEVREEIKVGDRSAYMAHGGYTSGSTDVNYSYAKEGYFGKQETARFSTSWKPRMDASCTWRK